MITTESYVTGAMVLGHSIERSSWNGDAAVLVTSDVGQAARERLGRFWRKVVEIQPLANPHTQGDRGLDYFDTMFTKLRIWELTDYERVVYVDSDAIVLGSLEELPDRPSFAAAPCLWPPDRFNSGVLVVEPSRERFGDLVSRIGELPSYDGSDQGFLNEYYHDWFSGPAGRRLPAIYNVQQFLYGYGAAWKSLLGKTRVLHYTGPMKPWRLRRALVRRCVGALHRRFSSAAPGTPSPLSLWWEMHESMERRGTSLPEKVDKSEIRRRLPR